MAFGLPIRTNAYVYPSLMSIRTARYGANTVKPGANTVKYVRIMYRIHVLRMVIHCNILSANIVQFY